MKFGIFDHMDAAGAAIGEQYESRLQLIEAYDRGGFYAYHLAEHHGTPLGYAPSPNVFLAAVAQRTKSLRFGPLVYLLPLYHPLRLIEEICMLDQMSGGRFQLGVGQGASPIEVGFYGVDPGKRSERYNETLEAVIQGLTSEVLNHHGNSYRFENVPMVIRPVQRPHPPLWCGVMSAESTVWAAGRDANMVTLRLPREAREITDRYRSAWQELGKPASKLPLLGVSRHIVLSGNEEEAKRAADRAYRPWRRHLEFLWKQHGVPFRLGMFPQEFHELQEIGGAFAGTAAGARAFIENQIETSGANYFCCDVAFGDLTPAESTRTVEIMANEVMPAFSDRTSSAA